MGTRRDFLRHGSLWLAAGLITPAALDRLQWTQRRIFALGSSLERARVTLFGPNGNVLRRLVVPVTYGVANGGRRPLEMENLCFHFDSAVTVAEIQTEIPIPDFGDGHMVVNRVPLGHRITNGDTLNIQYPRPLVMLPND